MKDNRLRMHGGFYVSLIMDVWNVLNDCEKRYGPLGGRRK
jgi:hypothetical protein